MEKIVKSLFPTRNIWDIVLQEVLAEELSGRIVEALQKIAPQPTVAPVTAPEVKVELPELPQVKMPQFKSIPINLKNKTISDSEVIFNGSGIGQLVTLTIVSPSNNYSIFVKNEAGEIWNDSYDELAILSESLTNITAVEDEGNYIINIFGIYFLENLFIRINVAEPITFTSIRGQINILEVI